LTSDRTDRVHGRAGWIETRVYRNDGSATNDSILRAGIGGLLYDEVNAGVRSWTDPAALSLERILVRSVDGMTSLSADVVCAKWRES
jgi:hypothetical protein